MDKVEVLDVAKEIVRAGVTSVDALSPDLFERLRALKSVGVNAAAYVLSSIDVADELVDGLFTFALSLSG